MNRECVVCNRATGSASALCVVHSIASSIGIIDAEPTYVLDLTIRALISRLKARATARDSDALLTLLDFAEVDKINPLILVEGSLEVLEAQILLGATHPSRIARAELAAHEWLLSLVSLPERSEDRDDVRLSLVRFHSLRGRIAHLRGDFALAAAVHERNVELLSASSMSAPEELTILERSLVSASLYLSGEVRDSRRLSDELFENTSDSRHDSAGVLVTARFIEHGIAAGEIDAVVELAHDAASVVLKSQPGAASEAIWQVMLLRDAAKTLDMAGEKVRSRVVLEQARELAVEFGLLDQVNKLVALSDEMNAAMSSSRDPKPILFNGTGDAIRYQ